MNQDFIQIIGILIISFIIIYLVMNMFVKREGLENADGTVTSTTTSGEAGNAANYAASIKALTVQLQDSLLVSKYRTDYENVIINMDDYFSFLMLKQTLNMDPTADTKTNMSAVAALNALSAAKKSLNETMVFVDKQP
jgi:hypothetical protein